MKSRQSEHKQQQQHQNQPEKPKRHTYPPTPTAITVNDKYRMIYDFEQFNENREKNAEKIVNRRRA